MSLSHSLDYSPITLFILLFFSSKSLTSDPRQRGTRRLSRYISLACLVVASLTVAPVSARDTTAHWNLGIGIGGLSIPHYRGSDQRQDYVAPIPYVRYEGKRLKIDREGGRFYLYKGDSVQLDLSTGIAFPVDSHDNRARQGMPDLHPVFELGPRAQYVLYTNPAGNLQWRLALPVRLAIATNIRHTQSLGLVFSPYIQLRYLRQWDTAVSAGPLFASETYHDYYYQVDPQYATATRPAYDAKGGYSGVRLTLSASRRFRQRYWLGVFLRYDRLDGAVFAESPLVKQNHSFMAGLAFAWILSQGGQR